jgi:hypothetical protein
MANLKDILATLAILSAGTLAVSGCEKKDADASNPPESTGGAAEGGEAGAEGGAAEGGEAGAEGEGSCSGDKAGGEGSCSGDKAGGEGSCSGSV